MTYIKRRQGFCFWSIRHFGFSCILNFASFYLDHWTLPCKNTKSTCATCSVNLLYSCNGMPHSKCTVECHRFCTKNISLYQNKILSSFSVVWMFNAYYVYSTDKLWATYNSGTKVRYLKIWEINMVIHISLCFAIFMSMMHVVMHLHCVTISNSWKMQYMCDFRV